MPNFTPSNVRCFGALDGVLQELAVISIRTHPPEFRADFNVSSVRCCCFAFEGIVGKNLLTNLIVRQVTEYPKLLSGLCQQLRTILLIRLFNSSRLDLRAAYKERCSSR